MIEYISLVLFGSFLASFGAYYFKISNFFEEKKIFNKKLILGGFFYCVSVLINMYVLIFLDLTIVVLLSSTTYIFSLFIGNKFLKEKITYSKVFGIILMIIGLIFIVAF